MTIIKNEDLISGNPFAHYGKRNFRNFQKSWKQIFENTMLAQGFIRKAFGWWKKTKLGAITYYA